MALLGEREDGRVGVIETLPLDYRNAYNAYEFFLAQHDALVAVLTPPGEIVRSSEMALDASRLGDALAKRLANLANAVNEVKGVNDKAYVIIDGTVMDGSVLAYFLGGGRFEQGMYQIEAPSRLAMFRNKVFLALGESAIIHPQEVSSSWKSKPDITRRAADGMIALLPNGTAARTILSIGK